jgi:hypothetical protein
LYISNIDTCYCCKKMLNYDTQNYVMDSNNKWDYFSPAFHISSLGIEEIA